MASKRHRVKEHTIKEIYEICLEDKKAGDFEACKESIADKVYEAWEEIYALSPRVSLLVGFLLFLSIILFEMFILDPNTKSRMVRVIVALAAAGVLTPIGGWIKVNFRGIEAMGSIAIFVLVYMIDPVPTKTKVVENLPDSVFGSVIGNAHAASGDVGPERILVAQNSGIDKVNYIRIYYPIGLTDLKKDTFKMRDRILSEKWAGKVEIYSIGSFLVAAGNSLRYTKGDLVVNVDYHPSVDPKLVEHIADIATITGAKKEDIKRTEKYTDADISIYFKIK